MPGVPSDGKDGLDTSAAGTPMIAPAYSLRALSLVVLAACAGGSATQRAERPTPGTTVTAQDISKTPDEPIENALMARVPGVWITRTADGGIAVRLRGTTTVNASSEPLYVIDGTPIKPGPGGSLVGINPYDIAKIEVHKDAAATAMWGMRGANGVIVITTKRPGESRT
jgi:TonB-dependent SusC/RagA subfamily outer membrane receptor